MTAKPALTADVIDWGGPKRAAVHPFALTEAGAAESFAAAVADRLRHDHRRGRWLLWPGHRWTPDTSGGVIRPALDHVRREQHRALDLADSFERAKAVAHSSRLKDITGGEQVSARHLYGDPFTFRPVCKIFLSTNELPRVADETDGLWRRLRQVPFEQSFTGTRDDRWLKDALLAEAPGILAWLVRGCLAWQAHGLAAPAAVVEATAQYRADSDELGRFLDGACELVPGADVRASDLYAHYREWASQAGLTDKERLSATAFGRKCADRFTRVKTMAGIVYRGVARA